MLNKLWRYIFKGTKYEMVLALSVIGAVAGSLKIIFAFSFLDIAIVFSCVVIAVVAFRMQKEFEKKEEDAEFIKVEVEPEKDDYVPKEWDGREINLEEAASRYDDVHLKITKTQLTIQEIEEGRELELLDEPVDEVIDTLEKYIYEKTARERRAEFIKKPFAVFEDSPFIFRTIIILSALFFLNMRTLPLDHVHYKIPAEVFKQIIISLLPMGGAINNDYHSIENGMLMIVFMVLFIICLFITYLSMKLGLQVHVPVIGVGAYAKSIIFGQFPEIIIFTLAVIILLVIFWVRYVRTPPPEDEATFTEMTAYDKEYADNLVITPDYRFKKEYDHLMDRSNAIDNAVEAKIDELLENRNMGNKSDE
ncbi:MAG: hypothetical protein FWD34_08375 [Oscillospiraceae bacterium]|nr:hypothetical protein [Oscillospiraceae bacterium]